MSIQSCRVLDDIYIEEDQACLRFGNAKLTLSFSKETGALLGCRDAQSGTQVVGCESPDCALLILNIGGERSGEGIVRNSRVFQLVGDREIGHEAVYVTHRVTKIDGAVVLSVETREADWLLTNLYHLKPECSTVRRDFQVTYEGSTNDENDCIRLHFVRLILPYVRAGADELVTVEAPDYPVPAHFPLTQIDTGIWEGLDSRTVTQAGIVQHAVDAPGSVAGLVALHNAQEGFSVMCWPHSTQEFSIMDLERSEDGGVHLVQWLFVADYFVPGHKVEAGSQYFRIHQRSEESNGSWEEALRGYQHWYSEVGIDVPRDIPDWAKGAAFYEVHVGSAPFLGGIEYAPYPTMADLVDDLPRIKAMGFEVIQLMPHWPFCGYTVHDYHDIDNQYGDKKEFKRLVTLAHHMGLRVILDIVLHGCIDKEIVRWDMAQLDDRYHFIFGKWLEAADEHSRYRVEHPEWFMRDAAGEIARIYTWAFDHANPSYQDFIIGVLRHYIEELKVDGFRFDAPTWNCIPNWNRDLPYRPSSAYYASYHMLKRARNAIKTDYPDILFYTEPSGPLFRDIMDLTYNYDVEWLSGSLMDVVSERGYAGARLFNGKRITGADVASWLHHYQLALPARAETVHHLDSHDTFWWGELAQFRHEAFGRDAASALFALFAFIGGGIMNYVGGEEGAEPFYREVLQLRQRTPVLRFGSCHPLSVMTNDDMVVALLRLYKNEHALPLINLSDQPRTVELSLNPETLGIPTTRNYLVYDLFHKVELQSTLRGRVDHKQLRALHIPLAPYEVRVLQLYPITDPAS